MGDESGKTGRGLDRHGGRVGGVDAEYDRDSGKELGGQAGPVGGFDIEGGSKARWLSPIGQLGQNDWQLF